MAFSPQLLTNHLINLNLTQDSIKTVSHWIQFYKRYNQEIAQIWFSYLSKTENSEKILGLFYLLNEVLLNSLPQQHFSHAFQPILLQAVELTCLSKTLPQNHKSAIQRTIRFWQQKRIFPVEFIDQMLKKFQPKESSSTSSDSSIPVSSSSSSSPTSDNSLDHVNELLEFLNKIKQNLLNTQIEKPQFSQSISSVIDSSETNNSSFSVSPQMITESLDQNNSYVKSLSKKIESVHKIICQLAQTQTLLINEYSSLVSQKENSIVQGCKISSFQTVNGSTRSKRPNPDLE